MVMVFDFTPTFSALMLSCSLEASSGLVFSFMKIFPCFFLILDGGLSLSISLPIRELLLTQIYLNTYVLYCTMSLFISFALGVIVSL